MRGGRLLLSADHDGAVQPVCRSSEALRIESLL
jgi:hypothetical protein